MIELTRKRKRHSEWMKKRWLDPEGRKKYIEALHTFEVKLKKSISTKKYWLDSKWRKEQIEIYNTPERKLKISIQAKGRWKRSECRKKYIEAQNRPEVKLKRSTSAKKNWKNPKFLKKILKANLRRPTGIEYKIIALNIEGLRYTGNGMFWCLTERRHRNPDFKITGQNKVIELFGDYWHRDEDSNEIINEYESVGLNCLVVWEHEINDDIEKVENEIIKFKNKIEVKDNVKSFRKVHNL